MDTIVNLLKDKNSDCNFTTNIKKSQYCESNYLETSENKIYYNFLFCILDNFDILLSNSTDKKVDLGKRVIDICTQIEVNKDEKYSNFNYNKKFSIRKIQQSLQGSLRNEKFISSIYYLNDLYKTHFVIVDLNKKEYYETSFKNYPKKYLYCNDKKYYLSDNLDEGYIQKEETIIFDNDISKNIYISYLKALGNYKIDELKKICDELNLSYYKNNKIMKKKEIYDMINLNKLCL